jgi:hypothetical protein
MVLVVEPDPPVPTRAIDERVEVAANTGLGTIAPSGRVVGACDGVVLVEVVDRGGSVLARTRAEAGIWALSAVDDTIEAVRYGCDREGAGVVAPADVVVVSASLLPARNVTLVLMPAVVR